VIDLEVLIKILFQTWDFAVEVLPIFLFAVFFAAIIEEFLDPMVVEKHMTESSLKTVGIASFVGSLIPLCTCGMIPLAVGLRRKGASWIPLLGFLVAGTASSVPALVMTMLLGWNLTFLRLTTAIIFGVAGAFIIVQILGEKLEVGSKACDIIDYEHEHDTKSTSRWKHVLSIFWDEFNEFVPWLVVSLIIAGTIGAVASPNLINSLLGGDVWYNTFFASSIGVPFYLCGGTDIPLIGALLAKGMSTGSAIAMMNAAPTVNIPAIALITKWIGKRNMIVYMFVLWLLSAIIGVFVNILI